MDSWIIAKREMRLGFRNPWAYTFLALFTVFSLALLLIQSRQAFEGYTYSTGSMLHLILYLLPLMALMLGSFSITGEREEGRWTLLSTYSLSTVQFVLGKYAGLAGVLCAILAFGFGFSGCISYVIGRGIHPSWLLFFFFFSLVLVLLYLGIAMLIGTCCKNRWQALTFSVCVWFITILAWPALLVSVLGALPYLWIKPALVGATFFNPAEFIRVFMVIRMGGGSIFGPEYYQWIDWVRTPGAPFLFGGLCLAWIGACLGTACLIWERRRFRG